MGTDASKPGEQAFSSHISFPDNAYLFLRASIDGVKSGKYLKYENLRAAQQENTPEAIVYFYDCYYRHVAEQSPELAKKFRLFTDKAKFLSEMLHRLDSICADLSISKDGLQEETQRALKENVLYHSELGVEIGDYTLLAHALIYTLRDLLEDKFNSKTKQSWIATINKYTEKIVKEKKKADRKARGEESLDGSRSSL